MRDDCTRRTALRAAGTALVVGLAGCSSGRGGGDGNGGGDEPPTVEVGPNGALTFDPELVTVSPGTTVTWIWKSSGHNIVVASQPDGASWGGTAGGESTLYDEGHEYRFTFETTGTYEYYCNPHRSAGMTGKVVVE